MCIHEYCSKIMLPGTTECDNVLSPPPPTHTHSKRMHAIAMVEKGTTVQENLAAISALPGTVRSHPSLAPMTSTSSLQNLIDDDRPRVAAAGSAQ